MPRFFRNWRLLTIALGAIVSSFVTFSFMRPDAEVPITVSVQRVDLEEVVLASGTLTPIRQVSVGAQVNGQLKSLKVVLGDRVKQGQLLAEIDPVLQQNDLRRAEAALKNVQAQRRAQLAQLQLHQLAHTRESTLRGEDANAVADLEVAKSQVEATRANIEALNAQILQAGIEVETALANLSYTRIVAPMDGQVIAIVTQEGQTVVSAQSAPTILVLGDMDRMLVKVRISEADVIRVHVGQEAWFTILGAPRRRLYSQLQSVEPAPPVSQASVIETANAAPTAIYYNGLLEVANEMHQLKPSMTAQVSILMGRIKGALSIPAGLLDGPDSDGQYTVRVMRAGRVTVQPVDVGLSDHVRVQILGGLKEGEQVLVPDTHAAEEGAA